MNTEEKITVIQGTSNNLWLKPPRVYILVLIVIIILGIAFLTIKNHLSKPETIQQTEDTSASPSAQIPAAVSGGGERNPSTPPIPK